MVFGFTWHHKGWHEWEMCEACNIFSASTHTMKVKYIQFPSPVNVWFYILALTIKTFSLQSRNLEQMSDVMSRSNHMSQSHYSSAEKRDVSFPTWYRPYTGWTPELGFQNDQAPKSGLVKVPIINQIRIVSVLHSPCFLHTSWVFCLKHISVFDLTSTNSVCVLTKYASTHFICSGSYTVIYFKWNAVRPNFHSATLMRPISLSILFQTNRFKNIKWDNLTAASGYGPHFCSSALWNIPPRSLLRLAESNRRAETAGRLRGCFLKRPLAVERVLLAVITLRPKDMEAVENYYK